MILDSSIIIAAERGRFDMEGLLEACLNREELSRVGELEIVDCARWESV